MVAISNLINGGLLLVDQLFYRDLASPEQASVESYNVVRFLGGSGPYVQHPGFGISTDIPDQCSLKQVHLMSRHGERFPSLSYGKRFEAIMDKVKLYNGTFRGELEFFNDYTYFVDNENNYETETTSINSEGTFSGTTDAMKHGLSFRAKYNSLFNASAETLKVFTANSARVHQTSNYFARGFMGDEYSDEAVEYYILDEDASMGANSMTPSYGCLNYQWDINEDIVGQYNESYLDGARKRLMKDNEKFNLTTSDVKNMFQWCAYEINVRGSSPVCDLFTNEEYVRYSYFQDLDNYYANSHGNNLSATVSSAWLNATRNFLMEKSPAYRVLLSFTHDNEIETFHAALGLFEPDEDLPTDHIPFPIPYSHIQVTPQGARTITEKFSCGDATYVRYVVNDAVIPIKTCQDGPGFSCELSDFEKYIDLRLEGKSYGTQCGINSTVPSVVSFLWDYAEKNYTTPDGDF
ncbi:acid phosphatase [Metschnikowia bicuspidata var. bicuspidata NRRL YB-4993]|uniref:Acid phosphatase n=1 Tax=Metschnikowia bicuspidata var. bicuspidata NRRL YB-4993 TaxID=869754 RepID=A0A1A0GZ86_9ASCO|nr:acid phosphatase [Metschnikowia bicuspidata var. bicuspidata NRRL YB-4993]OBA17005.1 acid phosphatase [Metschnikowia bicuspidata var. bicuspidata NRRL YB-4993]